jgi:hypothetical protein
MQCPGLSRGGNQHHVRVGQDLRCLGREKHCAMLLLTLRTYEPRPLDEGIVASMLHRDRKSLNFGCKDDFHRSFGISLLAIFVLRVPFDPLDGAVDDPSPCSSGCGPAIGLG